MSGKFGRVAVIRAGIAGLSCATTLARAGIGVTLFEKSRRPGGRVATRRVEGLSFNHGAQFATAHGPDFAALLAGLATAGIAASWQAAGGEGRRMSFRPGMSALPAAMAEQAAIAGAELRTPGRPERARALAPNRPQITGFCTPAPIGAGRIWRTARRKPERR